MIDRNLYSFNVNKNKIKKGWYEIEMNKPSYEKDLDDDDDWDDEDDDDDEDWDNEDDDEDWDDDIEDDPEDFYN